MVQVRSRLLRVERRKRLGLEKRSPGVGLLRKGTPAVTVFDLDSWSVGRLAEQGLGFLNVHETLVFVLCSGFESLHRAVIAEIRGILEPGNGGERKQQDEAEDVSCG